MSEAQQRGLLTYEQAHAMEPVGYIYTCQTVQNNLAPVMMDHIALGNPEAKLGTVPVYRGEVVDTLKAQIRDLQEQLENYKRALANRDEQIVVERSRLFPEEGWFLPKEMLSEPAAISLNHLIEKAKRVSIVNVVVSPGQPYQIDYEADWIKYLVPIVESEAKPDNQTWIVKLGSAAGHLHEPSLINQVSGRKQEETIKRLMERLGQPNSVSLAEAFKQLANEICYGHVSLESVVQKAAGTYTGKLRSELPPDISHYCHPYAVPAERLAGNASAAADCADPKNCCTRNRPLNEQSTCTRVVNASKDQIKVHTDLGVPDVSSGKEFTCAECLHQAVLEGCCGRNTKEYPQESKPVYSVEALTDPTAIQKAVVMGMVGTPVQQEEARVFLAQHLQLVNDYPATMATAMKPK